MRLIVCLVITFLVALLGFNQSANATTSSVVIGEVRLGGEEIQNNGVAYKQYVVLYNQTNQVIDLTQWRLQYAKNSFVGSCSDASWSNEVEISGSSSSGSKVVIPYQLTDNAAGSVRVIDASNTVQDVVGWGESAPCFESKPVNTVPENNKSIIRYSVCGGGQGQDSNNNLADFAVDQAAFSIIESPDCTPECPADHYLIDNECVRDQCLNLPDVQTTVPPGYYKNDLGCYEIIQLKITELLPNAEGVDSGNEFIEFYNPTAKEVSLAEYEVAIGDDVRTYQLPEVTIAAHSYLVVKDSDIGFSLTNTKSRVILKFDDTIIDQTPYYESAKENEAWAIVNETWQYTNRPTPGAINMPTLVEVDEDDEVETSGLAPCAANQYRHPETNRCRLLSTSQSNVSPCKEGQYRSEETNRCRSIASAASASLVPCDPGEVRNPETNRCRKATAASADLVPCKAGQERNPETNRCRNVASTSTDKVAFAAEPIPSDNKAFMGWWIVGGVAVLAVGRIGWEWRSEIIGFFRRIGAFFTPGK